MLHLHTCEGVKPGVRERGAAQTSNSFRLAVKTPAGQRRRGKEGLEVQGHLWVTAPMHCTASVRAHHVSDWRVMHVAGVASSVAVHVKESVLHITSPSSDV